MEDRNERLKRLKKLLREALILIPSFEEGHYILHGMAECLLKKGNLKEGTYYLYMAAKREPGKWYHHRDLGLALADLGDRDQAIGALDKANHLYKKENGKDFKKIVAKIRDLKEMPEGVNIVFEKSDAGVTTNSYGIIDKYNSERGFGFIKDDNEGDKVFFHISKIKNKIEPTLGLHVKFVKEMGEKGPQASRVWMVSKY